MQRINKPRLHRTHRRIQAGLWSLLCGLTLLLFPWQVQAKTRLPPRPTATSPSLLPPRPTPAPPRPTPVPPPTTAPGAVLQQVGQATIILRAIAHEGAWTVVQWQGQDGVWHEVTGWRGHVRTGQVRWRVAAKDFGTGPFRWLLLDKPGGAQLCVSDAFTLPRSPYDGVIVSLESCR